MLNSPNLLLNWKQSIQYKTTQTHHSHFFITMSGSGCLQFPSSNHTHPSHAIFLYREEFPAHTAEVGFVSFLFLFCYSITICLSPLSVSLIDTHSFKKMEFQPAEAKKFFSTVRKEMALLATSLPDGIMVKTFEDRMVGFLSL